MTTTKMGLAMYHLPGYNAAVIMLKDHTVMGRLKMHNLKMQDWKMTDNFERNRRVWKMQDWKMRDNI